MGATTSGWLADVVGIGATLGRYVGILGKSGIGGLGASFPPCIKVFFALIVLYQSGKVFSP